MIRNIEKGNYRAVWKNNKNNVILTKWNDEKNHIGYNIKVDGEFTLNEIIELVKENDGFFEIFLNV